MRTCWQRWSSSMTRRIHLGYIIVVFKVMWKLHLWQKLPNITWQKLISMTPSQSSRSDGTKYARWRVYHPTMWWWWWWCTSEWSRIFSLNPTRQNCQTCKHYAPENNSNMHITACRRALDAGRQAVIDDILFTTNTYILRQTINMTGNLTTGQIKFLIKNNVSTQSTLSSEKWIYLWWWKSRKSSACGPN